MTGHHPKADRLPKELRALLPQGLAANRRGEIDRKYFPREGLDLCFGWFRDALAPLAGAGKLSYVLFQLAPWVGYAPKALDYLASLPERLPGWRIAVEFRNSSWIPKHTADVLGFLRDYGLAYVAVDCPWQPLIPAVTSDLAVFRFHGRSLPGWEAQMRGRQPSVAEKYDYLYRAEELGELAGVVQGLEDGARADLHQVQQQQSGLPGAEWACLPAAARPGTAGAGRVEGPVGAVESTSAARGEASRDALADSARYSR